MNAEREDSREVCAGCLGNAVCWLCAGAGASDLIRGRMVPCAVCVGSSVCEVCEGAGRVTRRAAAALRR